MVLPRDGGGGGDSEWARTERAKGVVHEAAPTLEATCKWGPRTTGTSARLTTSLGVPTTPASGLTSLQNNSELRQTLYLQFIVKDANKQVKRQMHKAGGPGEVAASFRGLSRLTTSQRPHVFTVRRVQNSESRSSYGSFIT